MRGAIARDWAEQTLPKLSRKSELAKAFRYMRSRGKAQLRYLGDGRLTLDNNPAERALRCVAIGRLNYLFAGSDAGGRRAAAICSLIEGAKLNGLNPQLYLADVARIFLRDERGRRPVFGGSDKFQSDPHWRDNLLFYEYFHGDNGAGLGASHQTGWTGIVATLIELFGKVDAEALAKEVRGAIFGQKQSAA